MAGEQLWTVVRTCIGTWTTGGRPEDYKEFTDCEIFLVMAKSRDHAKQRAQALRRRQIKKSPNS